MNTETPTFSPPDEEKEVCVACRASTRHRFQFKGGLTVFACTECIEDGSLKDWLVKELEAAMESGGEYEKLPNGHWQKREGGAA